MKDTLSSKLPVFEMKVLEVNFDEIQKAMEDVWRNRFDYYLDIETGQLISLAADLVDETLGYLYHGQHNDDIEDDLEFDSELDASAELPEDLFEKLEIALEVLARSDRYIRVPERDRSEAFECMRSFTEKHKDRTLKEILLQSLNGEKSFRRFKDTLIALPKERKQWNRYNAQRMRQVIRTWLKENGIQSARKRGRR